MANSIGLLNEKSLHAQLKLWYADPGDRFEVPVDGYIVDIVRGDLLIEIQTGSFSAIRRKLRSLLEDHALRVVYPIPVETWIVKLPAGAPGKGGRRRSPRRRSVCDVFSELVAFPDLIARPGFSLEVLLTREEEVRQLARGRGRRPSWHTLERRLLGVADRCIVREPSDLARCQAPGGAARAVRNGRPCTRERAPTLARAEDDLLHEPRGHNFGGRPRGPSQALLPDCGKRVERSCGLS